MLIAAEAVGNTPDGLHGEVNDFLSAMKRVQRDDRRAYECVEGGGARCLMRRYRADMRPHGTVRHRREGVDVKVGLPTGDSVYGRIVRSRGGVLTIAFRQDPASMSLITRTLDALRTGQNVMAG